MRSDLESLHIVVGVLAALLLLVPFLTKKGGRWHRLSGWLFIVAMVAAALSAYVLDVRKYMHSVGDADVRAYALFQAHFAAVLLASVQQGIYVLRRRTQGRELSFRTLTLPALVVLQALIVFGMGLDRMNLIYLVYGGLALGLSTYQFMYWRNPGARIRFHLVNMCVSGTVCLIAVVFELIARLYDESLGQSPIVWFLPLGIAFPCFAFFLRTQRANRLR